MQSPHPLAPLPRHPRTTRTARRRRLAGEPRAAKGCPVQARGNYRQFTVGGGAHLQLDSAQATGAPDPAADVVAQHDRSLEHDAEDRLAALFTARALTAQKQPLSLQDRWTHSLDLCVVLNHSIGSFSHRPGAVADA